MFSRKNSHESKKTAKRQLSMENLEGRSMMTATTLALDFTPDNSTGNFVDTFKYTRYSNGVAPAFLDFNGDRRVTNQDVEIAAGQIKNAVGTYFAAPARGYNVSIVHGDVLTQSNFGAKYLQYGQSRADTQVLVMYMGGRVANGISGMAPIAAAGYNVEGYGRTYTQEIALNLMKNPNATKEHFVWAVAQTVAHEYGHMFGLHHSQNAYANDMMNPRSTNTPWTSVFSIYNQRVENGTAQNAYRELQYSFAGQPTYLAGNNRGSYLMSAEEAHDCNEHLTAMIDSMMEEHGHDDHDDDHDHDHPADVADDDATSIAAALSTRAVTDVVDSLFAEEGKVTTEELTSPFQTRHKSTTELHATTTQESHSRRSRGLVRGSVTETKAVDSVFASNAFASKLV